MSSLSDLYEKAKELEQKNKLLVSDNEALMKNNCELKRALEGIELVIMGLDEDYDVYENNFYHLRTVIRGTKQTIYDRRVWEEMPFKVGQMPVCGLVETPFKEMQHEGN